MNILVRWNRTSENLEIRCPEVEIIYTWLGDNFKNNCSSTYTALETVFTNPLPPKLDLLFYRSWLPGYILVRKKAPLRLTLRSALVVMHINHWSSESILISFSNLCPFTWNSSCFITIHYYPKFCCQIVVNRGLTSWF